MTYNEEYYEEDYDYEEDPEGYGRCLNCHNERFINDEGYCEYCVKILEMKSRGYMPCNHCRKEIKLERVDMNGLCYDCYDEEERRLNKKIYNYTEGTQDYYDQNYQ